MTKPLSKTIAAEIRAEAARRQVTVEQIGEWLNMSRASASYRLNGHVKFSSDELQIIAEQMQLPVEWFLRDRAGQDSGAA